MTFAKATSASPICSITVPLELSTPVTVPITLVVASIALPSASVAVMEMV